MINATTRALLTRDEAERRALLDPSILDVSHGDGVPIGTLGSGHSVFGRAGFVRVTFDGAPGVGADFQSPLAPADFAFYVVEGERSFVLSEQPAPSVSGDVGSAATPMDRVLAYAELPKAHFRFERGDLELELAMTAFSPLIAHDLESSSTPVQIFELSVENTSRRMRSLEFCLSHALGMHVADAGITYLAVPGGEIAFGVEHGMADPRGPRVRVELAPGALASVRFFIAWFFPEFKTPSPVATATYRRHYTRRFADARSVVRYAIERADAWSGAIDDWHAAFSVPAPMKRLWFSSLSSVVTCTLLSTEPYFFAVETPHEWVNTMDVAVYANWVYLVNWPELEQLDLEHYFRAIETEGERAGFVWHSLWSDAAHYAEEPTFLTRLWRAYLWRGERSFLEQGYPHALAAANYAHRHDSFEDLLNSERGNQSYDEWMMPGVSAYVNVAWLFALYSLERMGQSLSLPASVQGSSARELRLRVATSLQRRLWSDELGGYFRCFFVTPGANPIGNQECVFTDQLFGRWVVLIDHESRNVLAEPQIAAALTTIYENNLLRDESSGFRGWVNGMLPHRKPDLIAGYHARTCWLGAQLDLASLLAAVGDESRSLDVFTSIEHSLFGNHLAVGEWNRAIDADGRAVVIDAFGKDTPRFPPYPRYTSSWEYLIAMLGLTLTEQELFLRPFRTIDFELRHVRLAGVDLSLRVERDWSRAMVDGVEVALPAALSRSVRAQRVEFIRG